MLSQKKKKQIVNMNSGKNSLKLKSAKIKYAIY